MIRVKIYYIQGLKDRTFNTAGFSTEGSLTYKSFAVSYHMREFEDKGDASRNGMEFACLTSAAFELNRASRHQVGSRFYSSVLILFPLLNDCVKGL